MALYMYCMIRLYESLYETLQKGYTVLWRISATCAKKKKKSYVGLITSYVGDNIFYVGFNKSYVGLTIMSYV